MAPTENGTPPGLPADQLDPNQSAATSNQTPQFVFTRLFNATREELFRAWTDEQVLKHWFAPKGFTIPVHRLNLRPGGQFHYCMRAPNGVEMWGKWVFREIVPPGRIVLVNSFSNKHGNLTHHPFVHDWPLELLATTTLTEQNGQTLMELRWIPIDPTPIERKTFEGMHDGMRQGWAGTLDQLETYLTEQKNSQIENSR